MNSIEVAEKIALVFEEIQAQNPLVQCITNGVTINDCANALLAVGASPVMAAGHDAAEMAEL
ncbi:MAG: hydroxyethylthiazole kinase, partial [Negativicutes bacterium]|nr:hydroxyethylthiazole kinase [Negativicutes bacterium]